MSVVGTLKITFRAITGLPADVTSAFFMVRVQSRKEHSAPNTHKVCAGPVAVSEAGDVRAETPDGACLTAHTPFPSDDVVRITVASTPRAPPLAYALTYARTFAAAPHTERTLTLKHPETRAAAGTLTVAVDYAPPAVSESPLPAAPSTPLSPPPSSSKSSKSSGGGSNGSGASTPSSASLSSSLTNTGGSGSSGKCCGKSGGGGGTPSVDIRAAHRSRGAPVAPETPEASPLHPAPAPKASGTPVGTPAAALARVTVQAFGPCPVDVTPATGLTFGLESRQAPLDTPLHQGVLLENTSGERVCFHFDARNDEHPKYTVAAEPADGKLDAGQTAEVALTLTVHCTTHLQLALPLHLWRGRLCDYGTVPPLATAVLTAGIQSRLSTRLDPDELQLTRPPIGDGSFGTVYRSRYRGFDVAVKVLKNQARPTPALLRAFRAEVDVAESLRHTCIATFVGAVHTPGSLALVTEYCPFGNLSTALTRYAFSLPLRLKALLDVARALDYLHQSGLLHRDLKTENILVVSLEPMSQVVCKLSDFGTARDLNSFLPSQELELTRGVGTPYFMAPETFTAKKRYTESADIYSFGLLMCHVANGTHPYANDQRFASAYDFMKHVVRGMRPRLRTQMSPEFVALMEQCWNANPAVRPHASTLSQVLEGMFYAEEAKSSAK